MTSEPRPLSADEARCRLAMEKMADCLEEGTDPNLPAEVGIAYWIAARDYAVVAVGSPIAADYTDGPYGGLMAVAGAIADERLGLSRDDIADLAVLVGLARDVPVGIKSRGDHHAQSRAFENMFTQVRARASDRMESHGR